MPADDRATPTATFRSKDRPGRRARRRRLAGSRSRSAAAELAGLLAGALALAGCGGGSSGQPAGQVTKTVTSSASPSASAPASAASSGAPASAEPGIVAVTAAGALVTLSSSGAVTRTLVPGGVMGDEISVAHGTVYFAVRHGCMGKIESVSLTGGTPVQLANGSLPAISPDGSKLAYASQPSLSMGCTPSQSNLVPLFKLVIRTVSTSAEATYPMVPAGQDSGLPAPISHLSWAPDGQHLAVSVAAIQDNEGWGVWLVDTAAAKYYLFGPGVTQVPVTGQPTPQRSYLREGVYVTTGGLFVSRACCGGVPVHNTSRLMWEVSPAGVLTHQVAIGFPAQDHVSLDAAAGGAWLLYVGGRSLYVSRGGARPNAVAKGIVAAAWG